MTPHPDTEPMLPRDPAATVDKAYDERDAWVETARMYAQNSDYWRARFDDLRHNLGLRAFTAPDEDETVMLTSLDSRIADAVEGDPNPAAVDLLRRISDALEADDV